VTEELSNTPIGDPRVHAKSTSLTGGSLEDSLNSADNRRRALDECKDSVIEMLMAPINEDGYDMGDLERVRAAVNKAEFVINQWRSYSTIEDIAERVYNDQHWWTDDTNVSRETPVGGTPNTPVTPATPGVRDEIIIE